MTSSYAEDRARIEDLQARYMFALDWQDAAAYAGTFTDDGVLDWAMGVVEGRAAIRDECENMRANFARIGAAEAPLRPARLRHFITNITLRIDGEQATGRAYWLECNNDMRSRWPYLGGYGHYEDELRKIGGEWLFARRKIYNECLAHRTAGEINPAGAAA